MPLPQNGQLNWGTPLNADILNDEATISQLSTSLAGHEANNPADPHGDRAYASALVTPITTGLNQAPTSTTLGLVQLNSLGKIPLSLVPVGAGLFSFIDAVPDYNVPTDGVTPAATALNNALKAANTQGGGIVWVGSGNFALDAPLIIYQNTWLMCSPGAIFTRIKTGVAPVALLQNFAYNIAPVGGNIRVSGGYWNVANLTSTGVAFSFAHTTAVLVEDLIVVANPDGSSPVAEVFGCTNVTFDNVSVYAALPSVNQRGHQHHPCFRVEEINPVNLPTSRCPNSALDNTECQNITARNCSIQAQSYSDSFGPFSCFTSFMGTTGTIQNGSRHVNINVVEGCYASALANAAIELNNWQNVTVTGCDFNNPKTPYLTIIDGVSPAQPLYFLYNVNSPDVVTPNITNITVINNIEVTVNQFLIPGNDWIPGNTCYRHHHGGILTCPQGAVLTIKIYVGINGNTSDTLCETITITMTQAHSGDPYCIHHHGFDVDSDGGWTPCGTEFFAPGENVKHCGSVRPFPTQGSPVYVTHTLFWDSTGRSATSKHGNHERRKQ